ncbi:MAG: dCTP deaminase [Proteobacteria bacterium]|nr:dCTP deaminase [Pseudomonadota bacterium]
MMLSNEDIRHAIRIGDLKVEPFRDEFVRAAGITMHLGEELLKPLPGTVVDVKNRILPEYKKIIIGSETPYTLQPGEFVLGHTYQRVTVGPSLGFLIEGRSTLARLGLTIVQTAMLVYPGHRNRTVTLELANHGPNPILLYHKMKIARVALFELKTPATELYDDTGKYRHQESVGAPIFNSEMLED